MSDREAFKAIGVSLSVALSRDDVMALMDFATKIRAEARDAALLEAAQVCDQKAATIWAADADDVPGYAELVFCAAAIRAKKEQQ